MIRGIIDRILVAVANRKIPGQLPQVIGQRYWQQIGRAHQDVIVSAFFGSAVTYDRLPSRANTQLISIIDNNLQRGALPIGKLLSADQAPVDQFAAQHGLTVLREDPRSSQSIGLVFVSTNSAEILQNLSSLTGTFQFLVGAYRYDARDTTTALLTDMALPAENTFSFLDPAQQNYHLLDALFINSLNLAAQGDATAERYFKALLSSLLLLYFDPLTPNHLAEAIYNKIDRLKEKSRPGISRSAPQAEKDSADKILDKLVIEVVSGGNFTDPSAMYAEDVSARKRKINDLFRSAQLEEHLGLPARAGALRPPAAAALPAAAQIPYVPPPVDYPAPTPAVFAPPAPSPAQATPFIQVHPREGEITIWQDKLIRLDDHDGRVYAIVSNSAFSHPFPGVIGDLHSKDTATVMLVDGLNKHFLPAPGLSRGLLERTLGYIAQGYDVASAIEMSERLSFSPDSNGNATSYLALNINRSTQALEYAARGPVRLYHVSPQRRTIVQLSYDNYKIAEGRTAHDTMNSGAFLGPFEEPTPERSVENYVIYRECMMAGRIFVDSHLSRANYDKAPVFNRKSLQLDAIIGDYLLLVSGKIYTVIDQQTFWDTLLDKSFNSFQRIANLNRAYVDAAAGERTAFSRSANLLTAAVEIFT